MTALPSPITDPNAPDHLVIGAYVDGVDAVARQMERKWGIGQLRLLVGELPRLKFDAARSKLDEALSTGSVQAVMVQADSLRRGYAALDRMATEAGHRPLSPDVWELTIPSTGEVVRLVRDEAAASVLPAGGLTLTLQDVAMMLDKPEAAAVIVAAKAAFPDARVTEIRDKPPRLSKRGLELDDEIPF